MISVNSDMMITACLTFFFLGTIFGAVYLLCLILLETFVSSVSGIGTVFKLPVLKIREYIYSYCMKGKRITFWQEECLLFLFIVFSGLIFIIFNYVFLDGVIRILPALIFILGIIISKKSLKIVTEKPKDKIKFIACLIFGGFFFYSLRLISFFFKIGKLFLKKINKISAFKKLKFKTRRTSKKRKNADINRVN